MTLRVTVVVNTPNKGQQMSGSVAMNTVTLRRQGFGIKGWLPGVKTKPWKIG